MNVLLCSLIAGSTCEVFAADYRNANELATIYVYREQRFMGSGLEPTVLIGDDPLVNVADGAVYSGQFPPGRYVIQMDDKKTGAELDVKPGERYYFKMLVIPGFFVGGGQLTLMQPEQGAFEVKLARPVPRTAIRIQKYASNETLAAWTREDMTNAIAQMINSIQGSRRMPTEEQFMKRLRQLPQSVVADAWGTPFKYSVNEDRTKAWFVSAGADRAFDESSWTTPAQLESLGDDAVIELSKDGGELRRAWK